MSTASASIPLQAIIARYRVVLVDNVGVLRTIKKPFPKAYAAIRSMQEEGKEVFLFSNNATATPEDLQLELRGQGVEMDEPHIITSGKVLSLALQELGLQGKAMLCLGNEATEQYIAKAGSRVLQSLEAEAAIIGGHAQEFDVEILRIFVELCVEQKKPALLVNTDSMVPVDEHNHSSGPAYGWKQLEKGGRIQYVYIGKPASYMYKYALEAIGEISAADVLAVGDCLETDILGASRMGIDSLLVLSGLHAFNVFQSHRERLDQKMTEIGVEPTYILPAFAY